MKKRLASTHVFNIVLALCFCGLAVLISRVSRADDTWQVQTTVTFDSPSKTLLAVGDEVSVSVHGTHGTPPPHDEFVVGREWWSFSYSVSWRYLQTDSWTTIPVGYIQVTFPQHAPGWDGISQDAANSPNQTVKVKLLGPGYFKINFSGIVSIESLWHGTNSMGFANWNGSGVSGPLILTGVDILKLQYQPLVDYSGRPDFQDCPGNLVIHKNGSLQFKALPSPPDATFPSGYPQWSISASDSEIVNYFASTVSTSKNDLQKITVQCGNIITVYVLVFEPLPKWTPAYQFPGRDQNKVGLGERVNLVCNFNPSDLSASDIGGSIWKRSVPDPGGSLGGSVWTATRTPGTGKLWIDFPNDADGSARAAHQPEISIEVIAPTSAYMTQEAGTSLFHESGKAGAGFVGRAYVLPSTVSFEALPIQEGTTVGVGTGYLFIDNGLVHPNGALAAPVRPRNTTDGSMDGDNDSIKCGSFSDQGGLAPFSNGDFQWNIPWLYQDDDGNLHEIGKLLHHGTIDSAGTVTIAKGGAGPFSRALSDPDSNPFPP